MIDLMTWLVEKILGKDGQRKININSYMLVALLLFAIVGTWFASHFYWEWNNILETSATVPGLAKDLNTIEAGTMQSETNEVIISLKLDKLTDLGQKNLNDINKIEGFLQGDSGGKFGVEQNRWLCNYLYAGLMDMNNND